MQLTIYPTKGTDLIRIGMTRSDVRDVLSLPFETISKGSSQIPTDSFVNHSIHVFYDNSERCKGVEIWNAELNKVLLDGHDLFTLRCADVKDILAAQSSAVTEDYYGFYAKDIGIGVYAPSHNADHDMYIKSIFVGGPDCYR